MREENLQSYGGEEIQEILRLAGVARRKMDYFSREDMVRAAAEMDVPESAIIEAEQLVRERQSEADDRAEYRRNQARELTKGICIGVPVLTIIIFGHAFHLVGNFFSFGKLILKPLGGLFFSRSTQHELDFHDWRNKRYRKAMNIPEPTLESTKQKTIWNTDVGYMLVHGIPKSVADENVRENLDRFLTESKAMSNALEGTMHTPKASPSEADANSYSVTRKIK